MRQTRNYGIRIRTNVSLEFAGDSTPFKLRNGSASNVKFAEDVDRL
jgi:hypothetical protein